MNILYILIRHSFRGLTVFWQPRPIGRWHVIWGAHLDRSMLPLSPLYLRRLLDRVWCRGYRWRMNHVTVSSCSFGPSPWYHVDNTDKSNINRSTIAWSVVMDCSLAFSPIGHYGNIIIYKLIFFSEICSYVLCVPVFFYKDTFSSR